MFEKIDAPYLTPAVSSVTASDWLVDTGAEMKPLESDWTQWVPGTDVFLERTVDVDRSLVLQQTGLGDRAVLGVSVSWMSPATQFRRSVFVSKVGEGPLKIRARLAGNEVSSTIRLRTSLVLLSRDEDAPAWVANEPGAMLLSETISISLEGDGSIFPMSVIDFRETTYPDLASWHLVSTSQMDVRFSSTYQVVINERDRKLVKAIQSPKPDREQTLLLDTLVNEVVAMLLELAYSLRDKKILDDSGTYEEGTVGAVLSQFLEDTSELGYNIDGGPMSLSRSRALYSSMARAIGAGRMF